jgi:serine/threonine protein kinase
MLPLLTRHPVDWESFFSSLLMLTLRGQVKLLDFGLAKFAKPEGEMSVTGQTPDD